MKTLEELVNHLKKYKDTVMIIGPGVQPNTTLDFTVEEFNENYTRKMFRREPEKLWKFYLNKMNKKIDSKDLKAYELLKEMSKDTSIIINQNINSPIINSEKEYNLHGSIHDWICPKCKIKYTDNYVFSNDTENNPIVEKTCELCGSYIRPTALFTGEKYNQAILDEIVNKINDTHTLFLIGVDYSEELILKYISDFGNIASFGKEDEKIIVVIQRESEDFNPNDLAFCNFLVKDEIEPALERFIKEYRK